MAVSDDVVHAAQPHGARVAQVVHVSGRGAPGEDLGSRVRGVAPQVNRDVDLHLAHLLRDVARFQGACIDKVLECVLHAGSQTALVSRAQGDRHGFKALAVMVLKDAGHQVAHGVLAQVGRYVGDADSIVLVALTPPQRCIPHREALGKCPCAGLVVGGIVRQSHESQGFAAALACTHLGDDAIAAEVKVSPVTDVQALVAQQALAKVVIGVELQQPLEHRDGFIALLELRQDDGAVAQCGLVIRVDGQGLVESLQRLGVLVCFTQHSAAVDERFDVVRFDGQCLVVCLQGCIAFAQALQHRSIGHPGGGEAGVLLHRWRQPVVGFSSGSALHEDHAQRVHRHGVVGFGRQVGPEHGFRLGLPAGTLK